MQELKEMSDHELLCELVEKQRLQEKKEKIRMIVIFVLFLVGAAFLGYYIHRLSELIRSFQEPLNELNASFEEVAGTLQKFDLHVLEEMSEDLGNLNALVEQIKSVFGIR